jgi:hypothetical protein
MSSCTMIEKSPVVILTGAVLQAKGRISPLNEIREPALNEVKEPP